MPADIKSALANAKAPVVYLVRHGHTSLNKGDGEEGRVRGWANPPLDEEGRAEIPVIASRLKGLGIKHVITSPLDRASETGKSVAEAIGASHRETSSLMPWHTGAFTGMPYKDVESDLDHFTRNPKKKIPDGESYQEFYDRWRDALGTMFEHAQSNPKDVTAAFAHSRNMLALDSLLQGNLSSEVNPSNIKSSGAHPPGSILAIEHDGTKWNKRIVYEPPKPDNSGKGS